MNEILFEIEPIRLGSAQCPKCSKFARVTGAGQDSSPNSCDYWYSVDCKTCGPQLA